MQHAQIFIIPPQNWHLNAGPMHAEQPFYPRNYVSPSLLVFFLFCFLFFVFVRRGELESS